jgi:cytochrome c peroxidase
VTAMNELRMRFSRILPVRWHARTTRIAVLLVMLSVTGLAAGVGLSIFHRFADDSGQVQSMPADIDRDFRDRDSRGRDADDVTLTTASGVAIPVNAPLDGTNKFFDPGFGTNGQACVTCHQPSDGFTIHVSSINSAFAARGTSDPLFRANDTANNPAGPNTEANYSLLLNLGVMRIGKTFKGNSDPDNPATTQSNFRVEHQNTAQFGPLPNSSDPQHFGILSLSLFRRPLVNTNVHLDSSVLWDGRASIGDMRAQVIGAAKTLLLSSAPSNDDADQVAAFMLGVYTDQVFDTAAGTDSAGNCTFTKPGQKCGSGDADDYEGRGGVSNLVRLATGRHVPCTNFLESPCVGNIAGYDIFEEWGELRNHSGHNAGRAAVARGEKLFNTATLHVPQELQGQLGTTTNCTGCHATRNIGNNPDPSFFARVGTDSLAIIDGLLADPTLSSATLADLAALRARVALLPQYQLTKTSGSCAITTVVTTDPGHAMVSGDICDVGKFKPPVLRGLAARSPYFHAGAAENIQMLIHFYNARFNIGLTEDQVNDLGAFLEAQ